MFRILPFVPVNDVFSSHRDSSDFVEDKDQDTIKKEVSNIKN